MITKNNKRLDQMQIVSLESLVPEEHLKISIQLLENGDREFTFHAIGKKYEDLLEVLA